MRLAFVVLLFVSLVGCSAAPAPQVLHPQYRHVATYAPGPFTGGATLHLVWTPELVRTDSAEPYQVRLCIGLFGPFEDLSALKESGSRSSATRPACPATGAVVSSEVIPTRSDAGNAFNADLVLPSANGFYDLRQIAINGVEPTYSAMSAGGIIEIRDAQESASTAAELACGQSGYTGTVVRAFTLRAADLAQQDETRGGATGPRPLRSRFRDYPADMPIVLCFFDGFIAAPGGPPGISSATFRPYDRFVVTVDPSGQASLAVAGYRDRIVVAPQLP
jgi:hypothetical protein